MIQEMVEGMGIGMGMGMVWEIVQGMGKGMAIQKYYFYLIFLREGLGNG